MIGYFFIVLFTGFLVLFLVYLVVRLAAAAYYRSKKEFEQWYLHFKEERKRE